MGDIPFLNLNNFRTGMIVKLKIIHVFNRVKETNKKNLTPLLNFPKYSNEETRQREITKTIINKRKPLIS
tara:strand:- start:681 stop:890 length:210 start_codon:yes stop_codon:yes gene_type:complete